MVVELLSSPMGSGTEISAHGDWDLKQKGTALHLVTPVLHGDITFGAKFEVLCAVNLPDFWGNQIPILCLNTRFSNLGRKVGFLHETARHKSPRRGNTRNRVLSRSRSFSNGF